MLDKKHRTPRLSVRGYFELKAPDSPENHGNIIGTQIIIQPTSQGMSTYLTWSFMLTLQPREHRRALSDQLHPNARLTGSWGACGCKGCKEQGCAGRVRKVQRMGGTLGAL